MKTTFRSRFPSATLAAAIVLLLAGCLEKHVIWSPDGTRAAVIAKDGLHFCDPDGKLTPLLMPGVRAAAWLGDSQGLVVARQRKAADWASIVQSIGPERAGKIEARAEADWKQWEKDGRWGVFPEVSGKRKDEPALNLFLCENHGEALRAKLTAKNWNDFKSKEAVINDVMRARLVGDQVQPGTVLHECLENIDDIRISPDGRAVAFTTDTVADDESDCLLFLALIDTAGASRVADRTAANPDWAPDGRSLVYIQASGQKAKDDVRLATLVRREVMDDKGRIRIGEKAEELAGMFFQDTDRVRCLRDGRILFNAIELTLPVAGKDFPADEHERLFALDLARQATLVRMIPGENQEKMPKRLAFFEVSPDEQRVLVGDIDGDVSVLTLATGDVAQWQEAGEYNLWGAPVWRNSEEITYAERNPLIDGKKPARKAEIILRKAVPGQGDKEKVLSRNWPDEMLESVYTGSDRN